MSRVRAYVPALVIAAAAGAVALELLDVGGASRHVVVLAFLMLGPGLAVGGLLGLRDPVAELTIALAMSVVIDGFVAGILLYAHAWSPQGALLIVAGISIAGSAIQLARARHARAPGWGLS